MGLMDIGNRKWAECAATLIASGVLFVLIGWPLLLLDILTHKPVAVSALSVAGGTAAIILGFGWIKAMGLNVVHVKICGLTVWRRR